MAGNRTRICGIPSPKREDSRHAAAKLTFQLYVRVSLDQQNVMMQGTPFIGKINIVVRLAKDDTLMTRRAGDFTGEDKKNPAEVGTKNIDVVIDTIL